MNTKLFSLFIFLSVSFASYSQDLSLDEILSRNFSAMGIDKLQKVNTISIKGTIVQQDAMPVEILRMRPDKYLMTFDVQDITAYQGYDGTTAWWTTPWTGNPKPAVMPEDRAGDIRAKADFDGILWHWKEKGNLVEPAGKDTVEGNPAIKLKVTKKDNSVEFLFIDSKSFMTVKRMYIRKVRGQEVPVEILYQEYRSVLGIPFSFRQDTRFGGQPYNSLQVDVIELDKPVDAKRFSMPAD
jgi:hypothetical protein